LDAGPFIAALEFACDVEAEILGKPAKAFFQTAVESTGFAAEEVLMIGDDAFADVQGALAAGLRGCLVQTGKYTPGDEDKIRHPGAWVLPSVVEAVNQVVKPTYAYSNK
jgi:ribonucleotide monophosphatase NagD (HAD superfamily)